MPASRREFLTGEAVLNAARRQAEQAADALTAATAGLPHAGDTLRLETRAMACQWAVILNPGPHDQVMAASDALSEVHRVERLLSVYRADSDVSRLNRLAFREPQIVTPELHDLLAECRRLWESTGGAFDAASRALILLWQECRRSGRVPSPEELEAALAKSGTNHVHLQAGSDSRSVSFDVEGVGLDFGAIGKGYAIDRAAAVLRTAGIDEFLVHGGHSSLSAAGGHAGQSGWPVGLKNPLFTDQPYLTLLVRDRALATSGSNVQYFRHEGRRYGHILDPRTGRPAEGLLSVSVLAPTAAEADAVSTALYVLGLDRAIEYCDSHPSLGAILTPPPARGRRLSPILKNIDPANVFPASDDVELN
jgi:thiamine biosynthesis lipoprotein